MDLFDFKIIREFFFDQEFLQYFCDFARIWSEIFEGLVGLDSVWSESEFDLSFRKERDDLRIFGPLEDILFRILESSLSVLECIGDMREHIERCLGIAG